MATGEGELPNRDSAGQRATPTTSPRNNKFCRGRISRCARKTSRTVMQTKRGIVSSKKGLRVMCATPVWSLAQNYSNPPASRGRGREGNGLRAASVVLLVLLQGQTGPDLTPAPPAACSAGWLAGFTPHTHFRSKGKSRSNLQRWLPRRPPITGPTSPRHEPSRLLLKPQAVDWGFDFFSHSFLLRRRRRRPRRVNR